MKKMIKFLLLIFICIIGINNVDAAEFYVGERYTKSYNYKTSVGGLQYTDGSQNYAYTNWTYRFSNASDSRMAYCLDPHKDDGNNYEVDRILGTTGSDIVRAYDIGTLKILTLGYNDFTTSAYGVSGDDLYNATSIALRAFILGLYDWGSSGIYYYYKSSALAYLGAQWAGDNAEYASIATNGRCAGAADPHQCFMNSVKSTYGSWYSDNGRLVYSAGSNAAAVIDAAKNLFREGVMAAADYMENGATESEITYTVGRAVQDERTEDTVNEHIIIDFNIENFPEDGVIDGFTVTPTTNNAGITIDEMSYSVDGDTYTPLTSDIDVSKLIEAENGLRTGTIKIRLDITKVVNEDCTNMNFTINYKYNDPDKEYQGALLKEINDTSKQRFLIVIKLEEGEYTEGSIPGTITCANVVCTTELSIPLCSDEEDEAISEIHAPEDIKKCILEAQVDDAGNSYRLDENLGGISTDNPYCEVFCKEDYFDVIDDGIQGGIKLNPQIGSGEESDEENVNCGTYFQLTAHVEGKKDCYTAGKETEGFEINREEFINNIVEAQEKMIKGYNLIMMADAADAANFIEDSCDGCSCSYTWYTKSGNYDGIEPGEADEQGNVPVEDMTDSFSFGSAGSCDYTAGDEETGYYCDGTCSEGTSQADVNAEIDAVREEGEGMIEEGYADYIEAITYFNGCTAAWAIEFPFEQKLSYYYNEYQGNDVRHPYYSLLTESDLTEEELYYLEAQEDTLVEEYEIEICTGTATDEYECEGDAYTYEEMNPSIQDYNYAPTYGDAYTERTFTICDENGCEDDNQQISDATFIRKTVKKAQSYITPSVFYQIDSDGRVTVRQADYEGSIVRLDEITLEELTNSLPITTLATGGGEFRLMLEDLGEFYKLSDIPSDHDNFGRLIDFGRVVASDEDGEETVIPGDNKDQSVAEAIGDSEIEKFNGDYVCYYYSDCRPDDCPNCEFVCEEGECHWEDCPECNFDCVGCVINLDELQLNFKPISTVTVESADRELGYNWNVNTTLAALSLLRDKAELTIEEIETENETIYSNTKDENGDSALEFSVRLNGSIIEYLREYNASVEDYGGYANDSLDCYAYTDDNGNTFANMFCYSEVIDHLVDEYSEQLDEDFVNDRISEGDRTDNGNSANANNYWTLWEDWTESEMINGKYTVIGGPAWK